MQKRCEHCKKRDYQQGRGLCWRCHRDPEIREQYERQYDNGDELTEEQLDAMIAEQMKDLPSWWWEDWKMMGNLPDLPKEETE